MTVVTAVTAIEEGGYKDNDKNIDNREENSIQNQVDPTLQEPSLLSPPSPAKPEVEIKSPIIETCGRCGYTDDPFWMKTHHCTDNKDLSTGR